MGYKSQQNWEDEERARERAAWFAETTVWQRALYRAKVVAVLLAIIAGLGAVIWWNGGIR